MVKKQDDKKVKKDKKDKIENKSKNNILKEKKKPTKQVKPTKKIYKKQNVELSIKKNKEEETFKFDSFKLEILTIQKYIERINIIKIEDLE